VNSHLFVSRYGVKNFEIADNESLSDRFSRCATDGMDVVVQEIIPGPDSRLERLQTYVNSKGRLSAHFFHNKLRQHPPTFGVMRVGFSTGRNPEVEALAERLLAHGGYRGYASIEFKRDPRDEQLKLIEINVRMPRSGLLAVAAGVNFPWIIYKDLVENEQLYVDSYAEGQYWIDTLPDLMHLIVNPSGEQHGSLREYLGPYCAPRRTHAVYDRRDMRPFLRQLARGMRRMLPGRRR
jgi:predicted ATP-grasp superfamily ATP-dependent carboligase